jgi:peptidoglycan/LPS O-acetylase OafA/YrhL
MWQRKYSTSIEESRLKTPARFYTLDSLRGIAALGVVFYHWNHFYDLEPLLKNTDKIEQPFYSIFRLFYDQGFFAVELFFALSGFIFFWMYSDKIREGSIPGKKFFIRRIARLYPLHLITLVAVLILQLAFFRQNKTSFVYDYNDLYHFILNIFLVSSWGIQKGNSFNGVSWSISVEFFLYITFFLSCKHFGVKVKNILVWVLIGICLRGVNPPIGQGISSFYVGGLTYLAYKAVNACTPLIQKYIKYFLTIFTGLAWLVVVLANQYNLIDLLENLPIDSRTIGKLFTALTVLIFFPLTILVVTLLERRLHSITKHLSFFGDISYSVYLIHFPLQLLFALCFKIFSVNPIIVYSQYFQVLFFLLIIFLSYFSYRKIEIPAQKLLCKINL